MHLFLTSVLPFLAHDHASAVAFLTCRHHNFHASIIPEFLSDEERVKSFCGAIQQSKFEADKEKQFTKLYNLFVQTPLMQFSPSLIVFQKDCFESILKPLLATKYFTCSLQRCSVDNYKVPITSDLLQGLSKVRSLTNLDLGNSEVKNEHLEIINSFPSLEALTINQARQVKKVDPNTAICMKSPPSAVTMTLRSLTMRELDPLFATQFIPNFPNLRKLDLFGQRQSQPLDLRPLSSSLPHLTALDLKGFTLENTESLNNLVHLLTLQFSWCHIPDLSFLSRDSVPDLTTFHIDDCKGLSSSSFASLSHTPNLHVLELSFSSFNSVCLQYLYDMVHLRKLDLSHSKIDGDSASFKTLMQNLFQLEELNLTGSDGIGNQGALPTALYSIHSRLRVLNLDCCNLVDDDLNGIGALKNTLEVLDLCNNPALSNEALVHCRDLVKLKNLDLAFNESINDLSPLRHCLSLEELDLEGCCQLTDDSFKVFSEEPNSFQKLRILSLESCKKLTKKVFEHLSNNSHLVYQLKELNVGGMSKILSSSATARNNICQLKGLRRLIGFLSGVKSDSDRNKLKGELMQRLKNLGKVD